MRDSWSSCRIENGRESLPCDLGLLAPQITGRHAAEHEGWKSGGGPGHAPCSDIVREEGSQAGLKSHREFKFIFQ